MSDPDDPLREALAHHQAGRLDAAKATYQRILQSNPDDANALNLLGMVELHQGRFESALQLVTRAVELAPSVSGFHNNLGNLYQSQLKLDEAAACYRRAIELQPDFFEAYSNLGVALFGQGKVMEAIPHFVRAINLKPDYASARNNLGNALRFRSMLKEAVACFADAIALKPDYYEAHSNLAAALLEMNELKEAEEQSRHAIALRPEKPDAYVTLGLTLEAGKRVEEALACYREAMKLRPDSQMLRFHLAALTGSEGFDAPPQGSVAILFDKYSDTFERHLVGRLKYRGPELLLHAVCEAKVKGPLDIVDLGCGTGLCGATFKPMASSLTGVDVSSRMIGQSRERGVYDALEVCDLVEFLNARRGKFDLAVAADVLTYLGDLAPTLAATREALRPGGVFAFTVEVHEGERYALRPTRRFTHSLEYLREAAGEAGLAEVSITKQWFRYEGANPVMGWIVVLRRPA